MLFVKILLIVKVISLLVGRKPEPRIDFRARIIGRIILRNRSKINLDAGRSVSQTVIGVRLRADTITATFLKVQSSVGHILGYRKLAVLQGDVAFSPVEILDQHKSRFLSGRSDLLPDNICGRLIIIVLRSWGERGLDRDCSGVLGVVGRNGNLNRIGLGRDLNRLSGSFTDIHPVLPCKEYGFTCPCQFHGVSLERELEGSAVE